MAFKYDPDADVLSIEVSKKPIDYAQEMGDLVVHFTKNNQPVLLEILHARKFFKRSLKVFPQKSKRRIFAVTR